MRYLFSFMLLLSVQDIIACSCVSLPEKISGTELNNSTYIALIRIKELRPVNNDTAHLRGMNSFFKIVIEEITHYKGSHLTEIVVEGGNQRFRNWTSCSLDMTEQQQWLVFAQDNNGTPVIYPCQRNILYRQADGFRNWQFEPGLQEMVFLDSAFRKKALATTPKDGPVKTYYATGRLEKTEHYKNGKRHGDAQYYFPSGAVYGRCSYDQGKPNGSFLWFYSNGAPENRSTYKNGVMVDSSIYYVNTNKGAVPFYISVYNDKGEILSFKNYGGNPSHYLNSETIYDPATKKEKIIYYYPGGQINSIQYRRNNKDWGEYVEYHQDGTVKKRWTYDANGKQVL